MNYWYRTARLGTLLTVVLSFQLSVSADNLVLSIEDLFRKIENSSTDVKLAHQDVAIASMRHRAERDGGLPDISVDLEADYLGNTFVLDRDFGNPTRSRMTHWGNSVSVSVYQPLYTGGELSSKIRMADAQYRIADNNLASVKDRMKMTVLQSYLELAKNLNLLNVYDENIRITEQLIFEMKARASQGLVLSNDVTRYELNLSNLNYDRLTVVNTISNLNYSIISYLHLNESDTIVPAIEFNRINFDAVPLSEWMAMSRQKSPTLRYFDLQSAKLKANEKLIGSDRLPKIGLCAGTSITAPITTHTPVLDKNLSRWFVGVKVSFTPSGFYKSSHKLKTAQLESARLSDARVNCEENIDRNLDRAYRNYIEAVEHVTTQRKNVELASEHYRIVERRFNNDLSLLTDMLDASASKLDAEMRLVNAEVDVLYYYFQLKYLSGTI